MSEGLRVLVSLAPALVFLAALTMLDSFRLVAFPRVARALLFGVAAAVVVMAIATVVLGAGVVSPTVHSRYSAPVLEELGKGALVLAAIRQRRVGFMVDAAILGFATGAGFACAENVYYLLALDRPNLLVWLVRGFGTATMHGSTTAVAGIVAQALVTRWGDRFAAYLPGLGIALVTHSAFNHFVLPPVAMAGLLISAFTLLVLIVFAHSERLLRDWLEVGLGTDMELLEMLRFGEIGESRVGTYLRSLRERFPPAVVADMLCYLLVMVELSIRAKVLLVARQAGVELPRDREVAGQLVELRYLEKSIGPLGRLAVAPFLHLSRQELWQLSLLAGARGRDQRAG